MNKVAASVIGALVLVGCIGPKVGEYGYVDEEGFTWMDGSKTALDAPSDYYIIRYECLSAKPYEASWMKQFQKWDFCEVRQLKGGSETITDGVKAADKRFIVGRNWRKWVKCGARNVRVKFVGADYDIARDGVETAPEGYVPLFNGRDLAGWRGITREEGFNIPSKRRAMLPEKRWELQAKANEDMKKYWHVRDGVLFFDGRGNSIAAEKYYGNYEVVADWRLLRVFGDSGFYLRGLPQVQIWDPRMWNGLGSACLWNNPTEPFAALECADRPIGSWNRCRMRIVGEKVWIWLNGVKTVDGACLQDGRNPGKGIPLIDNFELQCHGDPIEFRNIFLRELPEATEDIPDPSSAVRGERVDLLKDGLGAWNAADPKLTMGWSVKDGVLSNFVTTDPQKNSRGGSGGTHLVTKREDFFDFDLSYDVLVPTKCNSGVYLRGRYEIQVNDSFGRKTDCHNMAALYDLITPTVAAEKPAGEWQHVDLTLYKRHLTVTLNGVKIIDNQPVGGVTPGALDGDEFVPGPILLQGDHSNASFKNMILTKIVN